MIAHFCDIDEWWSEALRPTLRTWEDLACEELESMHRTIAWKVKATNMNLEGEISQIRASCPAQTRITAERFAYQSHLGLVLADHLQAGRSHPCRKTAAEMVAEGVPVEAGARKSHCEKPEDEQYDAKKRLLAEAKERSRDGRFLAAVGGGAVPSNMAAQLMAEDHCVSGGEDEEPGVDVFDFHDSNSIVRDEVLESFLSDVPGVGVAARAAALRKQALKDLYVADKGQIPDSKCFSHRLACHELHPGLCITDDADIYADTIKFEKSLGNCLGPHCLHQFVGFSRIALGQAFLSCIHVTHHALKSTHHSFEKIAPLPAQAEMIYYVARRRARRWYAPMTHVLISMVAHGNGSYSLEQEGYKKWKFMSLWSVGKEILVGERRWAEVFVSVLKATRAQRCSYTFTVDPARAGWSVWPGVFQKPKQATPST